MTERQTPADEQRVLIHQHLMKHPLLTVYAISSALNLTPSVVRRRLLAMERDGEAKQEITPKTWGTSVPITRWRAT